MSETLLKIDPTKTGVWSDLKTKALDIRELSLCEEFGRDTARADRFSVTFGDLHLDFSKNLIDEEVFQMLLTLADRVLLEDAMQKLKSGAMINETESRAVGHMALRAPKGAASIVRGEDVSGIVHCVLDRMKDFVRSLDTTWVGFDGRRITDVVNIGIGGSDLGPLMVVEALKPYQVSSRRVHFISNVDGAHISQLLPDLDRGTTLFIVASKSFTTIETMTNAHTARSWFLEKGKDADIAKHFVAVSTNVTAVEQFGIDPAHVFEFWDWVGGRYSLCSAIGLSIMAAVGVDHFSQLLAGMHSMDRHFIESKNEENIPLILALLGIWYTNFLGAQSEAVLPYSQNLQHLPAYLQQASMESNGKSVDRSGNKISYKTGAILWGGSGTNSQHSFFQLLHQGTHLIPCDFICVANAMHNLNHHHDLLLANAIAQCEALMKGKTEEEARNELIESGVSEEKAAALIPYKIFEGNRPSNMIVLKRLNPFNLGTLIALYEHKIFVQGYIWNIFSYDQFGVELGKQLANEITPEIRGESMPERHDGSTNDLIKLVKSWRD